MVPAGRGVSAAFPYRYVPPGKEHALFSVGRKKRGAADAPLDETGYSLKAV